MTGSISSLPSPEQDAAPLLTNEALEERDGGEDRPISASTRARSQGEDERDIESTGGQYSSKVG